LDAVVTQWNEKGFGFVEFTDGRRAYVHTSACDGQHLVEGEQISAVCAADDKNPGKWAAQQVRRGPAELDSGSVTEWRDEGGYGFVQLDDGRRAYIHRTAFGETGSLPVGTRLVVRVKEDSRNPGKWCVDKVLAFEEEEPVAAVASTMAGSTPASAAPPASSTRCSGVVTDWNGRGFGFITLDDGRRAYVHNSQCCGEHLEEGESIDADVVPDERTPGKWQALNVFRHQVGAVPAAKRQRVH